MHDSLIASLVAGDHVPLTFPDRGSALRLVTAAAVNVTAISTDRRYRDMSLLKSKEVAVAKAA